jgi:murein DD-endopeptidase MepM/ murein hydrolase activator NlpD
LISGALADNVPRYFNYKCVGGNLLKGKKKVSLVWLWGLLVLLLVLPGGLLLFKRLEGHPPTIDLQMQSVFIGKSQSLKLNVADERSGIRQVWVALMKDGRESVLVDKTFPAGNLWNGGLVRTETVEIPIDLSDLGFKDGKAVLRLMTRDYSWRKWGAGNQQYEEKQVVLDTRAPDIEVLSRAHNINQGGAAIAIYKLGEDCPSSGIMVADQFYPGHKGPFSDPKIHLAFFALNHEQGPNTSISVVATDLAGNQGRAGLPHHINSRRFKKDTLRISDNFLDFKMPEFKGQIDLPGNASGLDTFLKVNRDLRNANDETIKKITSQTDAQIHWKGDFLRLPNAANRAGFADHRTYMYGGKQIDEQTHLGIDLASVEQSPVPAGNSGKVVFAEYLGIYGHTVMLDHGYGLFSMYSHLSHIDVPVGRQVARGEIIGKTGLSGMAGGDHLHFSVLVHNTFVNPLEWWDPHWIKNNILIKLDAIK